MTEVNADTHYILNYNIITQAGSDQDRQTQALTICGDSLNNEQYENNRNARIDGGGLPFKDRTCGECLTDAHKLMINNELSGVYLPVQATCPDGTDPKNICGEDAPRIRCEDTDGDGDVEISTISACLPGFYLDGDLDIDTCERCVRTAQFASSAFDSFVVLCDNANPVPVYQETCPEQDTQFVIEYFEENQCTENSLSAADCEAAGYSSGGLLKCQDHTICADGHARDMYGDIDADLSAQKILDNGGIAQKEIAEAGAQWDRLCACDESLIVGATSATCAVDADGTIQSPISALTCQDGFVATTDKSCTGDFAGEDCNVCTFDFNFIDANAEHRCSFKPLSELFQFSYALDDSTILDSNLGSDLDTLRAVEKKLLEISLDLTITNLDDVASDYKFFEWDSSTGVWSDATKVTRTHTHCYIKPSYTFDGSQYTPNVLTDGIKAGCDSVDTVNLFEAVDQLVADGGKSWAETSTDYEFYEAGGYTIELPAYSVAASHKLIGVASLCGSDGSNAIHDVFAWSDLRGSGAQTISLTFTPANLQADQSAGVTISAGVGTISYAIEDTVVIDVTDLLYIHGEQPTDISAASGATTKTLSFTLGSAVSENAVQHAGEYTSSGDMSVSCTAELEISANDDSFHCFDSHSQATYPTVSNGEEVFSENAVSHGSCTAELTTDCTVTEDTNFQISDARKCYNTDALQTGCNLLTNAAGEDFEQPSEVDLSNTVSIKGVVIEAIRLGNSRNFPKTKDGTTADQLTASDFDDVDETLRAFTCDTVACEDDPYLVLAKMSGSFDVGVDWDGNSGTTAFESTVGCQDATTGVDSTCSSPSTYDATVTGAGLHQVSTGETPLVTPGENYPQFYAYGYVEITDTAEDFNENVDLGTDVVNQAGTHPGDNPHGHPHSRRLGAPRRLEKVTSKSMIVVAPKHVVA